MKASGTPYFCDYMMSITSLPTATCQANHTDQESKKQQFRIVLQRVLTLTPLLIWTIVATTNSLHSNNYVAYLHHSYQPLLSLECERPLQHHHTYL